MSLRQIRSNSMGQLVTLRGMIVRASDVKPACVVATYTCDACGCEIYQVVQNKREFMPQRLCPVEECRRASKSGDTLHLQTRGSKFVKFQVRRKRACAIVRSFYECHSKMLYKNTGITMSRAPKSGTHGSCAQEYECSLSG